MNWKSESQHMTTDTTANSTLMTVQKEGKKKEGSYKHTITFTDSIVQICTHIILNFTVPNWLKFLTSKTRRVKRAGKELGVLSALIIRELNTDILVKDLYGRSYHQPNQGRFLTGTRKQSW